MPVSTVDIPNMNPATIEKFWSLVDKRSSAECWNWAGTKHPSGYGVLIINKRQFRAHRVAFFLANGKIKSNLILMHKCDNPSCVNPSHLNPGTQTQNLADMERKGRRAKGERMGISKITRADARRIRSMYQTGQYKQSALAQMFGITQINVSRIVRNILWKEQ